MTTSDLQDGAPARAAAPAGRTMTRRRLVFAGLVTATCLGLLTWMARILGADGIDVFDAGMLVLYAGTLPWVVIGLWNALVGVGLLHLRRDWLRAVLPIDGLDDGPTGGDTPVTAPTAIVMPVYNEDPERVFRHLQAMEASLARAGGDDSFEFFLLSDTNDPALAREEERRFEAWRQASRRPDRLHYRRRLDNARQKVGNLENFCQRWGDRFRYMIVLDADSLMTGEAIRRLVRLMERNPRIGILQNLIVGMPADSAFARLFQFGMRHGMRAYTTGSAWWQGDAGPYWGHNAILRLQPFIEHCALPKLPGRPPLGGEILSHDQVEAALMRSAGYEVRVLPVESGSFEENPPTFRDFMKRDLRWCQGNMQYLGLLGWPVWLPLGRIQLALAILMYLAAPLWIGFLLLGIARLAVGTWFPGADLAFLPPVWDRVSSGEGILLFATMMVITFAPKLLGMLDVLLSPAKRAAYGGGPRVAAGSLLEVIFGALLAPVAAVYQSLFILGLFAGRRVVWDAQTRDLHRVTWRQAAILFWPQTLLGVLFLAVLAVGAPGALPWAAPLLAAWLASIPFAVLTANPGLGRVLRRWRLAGIPEEFDTPVEIRDATAGLPALPAGTGGPVAPTLTLGHAVPSSPES